MVYQTSTNLYSYSKYIVDNSAGSTTYTTIQAAINDANTAGGGTILIRPGTYVENLTLRSLVNLEGASGSEMNGSVTITGVHTPPAAGSVSFKRIYLASGTDILNSGVAGTTVISLESCRVNCTNGYVFNLPNWAGNIDVDDVFTSSAADGFCNSTSTSRYYVINSSIGAGANAMVLAGGTSQFINTAVQCPQTIRGTANVVFKNCTITSAQTYSINSAGRSTDTAHIMTVAADIPITTTSAGAITLENVTIDSTAGNVIAGTGPVTFGSITYISSTGVAGTIVRDFTTRFETGVLKLADASTGALMATTGLVTAGTLTVGYGGTGQTALLDHAVLVGSGTAGVTAIAVGATGELLVGATGADPAFGTIAYGNFSFSNIVAATPRTLAVSNTDTNAASYSDLRISVPAAGADAMVSWEVQATLFYAAGVDNSDADNWKLTNSSTPSTGNTLMRATNAGAISFLAGNVDVTRDTSGAGTVSATLANTDNTATASNAALNVSVGGTTSTGDPYVNWLVTGGQTYSLGIDNSDSDKFKITSGVSPSAGTDLFTMTSAGVITLANDLDVSEGGTGVSTLTSHGILMGNGAGDIQATAEPANGQLLIGKTGDFPQLAAITPGPGIAITSGAGTITVSVWGGGVSWTVETVNLNFTVNKGIIANKAGLLTVTLPATAAIGDILEITGINTAVGWRVAQNANQQIHIGSVSTTPGVGGYVESTAIRDSIKLVCVVAGASTEYNGLGVIGNLTIA